MTITKLACFQILVSVLLLEGCAAPGMYQWGAYDKLLYDSYKYADKVDAFRQGLEAQVTSSELAKRRVAPGLYAEVGTLYLQAGDGKKAIAFYAKEKEAWPESAALMDALIQNVDKRSSTSAARPGLKP